MSYVALYNEYRPQVFEDVVEQKHVVETLKNSVIHDRVAHAYLFCGTRGTGKTTVARIFARAINCLEPINGNPCNRCEICKGILSGGIMDVVEIDAASNNSVDNIRNIRDEVLYKPSHAKHKVYIIDEVHMLSTGAFNALLKTLEEPPSHVVFFLATTEPHKLPATIISRCQRFDFKRISIESIIDHITEISSKCGVTLDESAARLIARLSEGALRDAISLLDQCITQGKDQVSYGDVLNVAGIVEDDFVSKFIDCIQERNVTQLLTLVDKLVMEGKDISQFVVDLIKYYRNLLLCKVLTKPEDLVDVMPDTLANMKKQSARYSQYELMEIIKEFSMLEADLKWSTQPRVLLEVGLIKVCEANFDTDSNSLTVRLSMLEEKVRDLLRGAPRHYSNDEKVALGNEEGDIVKGVENNAAEPGKNIQVEVESDTLIEEAVKAEKTEDTEETLKAVETVETEGSQKYPVKKPAGLEAPLDNGVSENSKEKPIRDWVQIINEIKKSGKMGLFANLLDTKAIEISDKLVGIIFQKGRKINRVMVSKPENLEILKAAISKKLGRDVNVKCMDEEEIIPREVEYSIDEDIVKKARDFANEFNVPFNIIDE